jgi:Uma2 family endonuclease
MAAALSSTDAHEARSAGAPDEEQRFVLTGTTWAQYEALRTMFDDRSGVKLTYLKGTLEIMSPSHAHERGKTILGRVIEAYATERGIELFGAGSTTFKRELMDRGLEPDECSVMGTDFRDPPDFAVEVVVSSWKVDRLEVYRGLGVREVWVWRDDKLTLHRLGRAGYDVVSRSEFLADLDPEMLARFVAMDDGVRGHTAITREFLAAIRA